MKIKQPILIPLTAFFVSLCLVWGFLKAKAGFFDRWKEPTLVLIAKQDILEGTLLDESLLETAELPRQFLQPGFQSSFEEVVGKMTIAPLLKGEEILGTKLSSLSAKGNLAAKIPPGLRALSLLADEASGVAGLIRPNDFVDLIATFEMENEGEALNLVTNTLAQRILVLAVGDNLETHPPLRDSRQNKKGLFSGGASVESLQGSHKRTVTLALTPEQSQAVEFAKRLGKISLTLRSPEEEESSSLAPTTSQDILGFKGKRRRDEFKEYRGE